jgi:hypothetical protein
MPWNAKTDGGRKCAGQGDSDYVAAQRACCKYLHGEEGDLSAKLEEALTSGWSIEALKAYAFSIWQQSASDDVTDAAWRLAVEFADSNGCSGGRNFLKWFSANAESYLVRCTAQRREVMSEHNETRSACALST